MEPIGSLIVDDFYGEFPSKRFNCDYTVYSGNDNRDKNVRTFQAEFHNGELRVIGRPYEYHTKFSKMGIEDAIDSLDEKMGKVHKLEEDEISGFLPEHHALLPEERSTD